MGEKPIPFDEYKKQFEGKPSYGKQSRPTRSVKNVALGWLPFDKEVFGEKALVSDNVFTRTISQVHNMIRTQGWKFDGEHYSQGEQTINYRRGKLRVTVLIITED